MAPLAGPSVGTESFGRGENIGVVVEIPLAIDNLQARNKSTRQPWSQTKDKQPRLQSWCGIEPGGGLSRAGRIYGVQKPRGVDISPAEELPEW